MPITPDYERVIATITERIGNGTYAPGAKLPSIAELAVDLQTSQTTVKNAQAILRRDGVIVGHPGKGVYVPETESATGP